MDKLVERIEREAGVPDLAGILATRLSPTDLQSLLLEVHRLRVTGLNPSTVLSNYQTNRFVRPSPVSPAELLKWEEIAFSRLPPEFQPLALAPLAPLGTCSVVAPVDQDWAVSTTRNTEGVSDSTNVLALECAHRRQELLRGAQKSSQPVHLAASHRLLRAQSYESPDMAPHFSSFALCSAGRDQGQSRFELSALKLHIRFYLEALRAYLGVRSRFRLALTDFSPNPRNDLLQTRVASAIRSQSPDVECALEPDRVSGRGYYVDFAFHIFVLLPSGKWLELVDGGTVNWTQQFLSNAKERLLISGIGSDRLCAEFGVPSAA